MFVDTALLLLLLVAIIFVSSLCRCSRRREREENSGEDVVSFLSASSRRFCQSFLSFFCFSFNDAWAKRFVFTTTFLFFRRGNRASTTAAILSSDDMMSLAFIAVLLFLFFIAFFARVHSVWCLLKDDFICRSNELHVLVHIFSIDGDYLFFFLRKVTRHLRFGTKKNYRSSSIVLSSSSSDPRRRNKNPKGFHTFLFLHFCLRRDTNAHTSALLIA